LNFEVYRRNTSLLNL